MTASADSLAPDTHDSGVSIRAAAPEWRSYTAPSRTRAEGHAIASRAAQAPWPALPPLEDVIPAVAACSSPLSRLSRLRHEQEVGLWNG